MIVTYEFANGVKVGLCQHGNQKSFKLCVPDPDSSNGLISVGFIRADKLKLFLWNLNAKVPEQWKHLVKSAED